MSVQRVLFFVSVQSLYIEPLLGSWGTAFARQMLDSILHNATIFIYRRTLVLLQSTTFPPNMACIMEKHSCLEFIFFKKGGNGPNIFWHGIDFMSFARVEGSFILISLPLDYFITEYSSVCVIIFSSYLDSFFFLFSPSFSRLRALVDDGWFMLRVPRLYCCDSFSLRLMVMDDQWHNPHTYWRIFSFFLIPFGWL